jgi:exopolysaccharide biosynthesis polyprenyl glycosylphosphotransferase
VDINESEVTKESIFIKENRNTYVIGKRLFDIILSIVLIILLSPIFLMVGIIIKFDGSRGEVFFKQDRVGINGKTFKIYKFRSMYPDAEKRLEEVKHLNEIEGHMFKIKKDPRVTNIGRFIRAYSIDELPQIINVLKGDMSLIGPRPPLLREYENYTDYDKKRLSIRPGITGLWQVSGRNSLSFDQMVALDLKYIRELSFMNDLKITFKTIVVILKKENAY